MWQTCKHGREDPRGAWPRLQRAAYNSRKYININSGPDMQVSSYAWLGAKAWISKHFLSKKPSSWGKTVAYSHCCWFSSSFNSAGASERLSCAPIGPFALYTRFYKTQCFVSLRKQISYTTFISTEKKITLTVLSLTASWLGLKLEDVVNMLLTMLIPVCVVPLDSCGITGPLRLC